MLPPHRLWDLVRRALEEDLGSGDLTTEALVPEGTRIRAAVFAQRTGIVCGLEVACLTFRALDPEVCFPERLRDGDPVQPGDPVLRVEGCARAVLGAERTALNFLQRLSGIATFTRQFVEAVAGTPARIADTRKTTPGLRALEKYAVRVGGGVNHRFGLYDGVLIKDNHLAVLGGDVAEAVRRARAAVPHTVRVEVECATLDQVRAAVEAGADALLLDNMPPETIREAVALARGRVALIEASGGVNLENVRAIAETGVDLISIGALTHSAPILPMHLEVEPG